MWDRLLRHARLAGSRVFRSLDQRLGRLYRPPWLILTLLTYALLFSIILQAGYLNAAALIVYAGLALWGLAYPKFGLAILLGLIVWTLYDFAGSPHPVQDLALLAAALAASVFAAAFIRRRALPRQWPTDAEALLIACLFLPFAWALVSLGDAFAPDMAAVAGPSEQDAAGPQSPVRIGLALSGGGYRAALFHAGVLAALRERKIPIEVMSSVSGGSLIASYYARGGEPETFKRIVARGSMAIERYVLRMDNTLCLIASAEIPAGNGSFSLIPFLPRCSRAELQSRLIERELIGRVLQRDGSVTGRPEMMVATTDVATHSMIGITPHGFVNVYLYPQLDRFTFANPARLGDRHNRALFFPDGLAHVPGEERLSRLVAASGAFPGAFRGYRIEAPYTLEGYAPGKFVHLLTDGGVADNSGIVLLDAAQELALESQRCAASAPFCSEQNPPQAWNLSRWKIDLILASDASAYAGGALPSGGFDEFVDAMDMTTEVSGGKDMLVERDAAGDPRPPILLLSPRSYTPDPPEFDNHQLRVAPPIVGLQVGKRQYGVPEIIGRETLQYMVDRMKADGRAEASKLLADLTQAGVIGADGVSSDTETNLSRGDLDSLQKLAKLDRLSVLIEAELRRRSIAFILTPTLRDRIDEQAADDIFTLGEYVARLNQPYIDCAMKRVQEPAPPGDSKLARSCGLLPAARAGLN